MKTLVVSALLAMLCLLGMTSAQSPVTVSGVVPVDFSWDGIDPNPIAFTSLAVADNSVTAATSADANTPWKVTAVTGTAGIMSNAAADKHLASPIRIESIAGGLAEAALTETRVMNFANPAGSSGDKAFTLKQLVTMGDYPDTYSIIITFTGAAVP